MIKAQHPTIFAWHGSALPNWHDIIRSGLDFEVVNNGRVYGDGCYHSQKFATSVEYSQHVSDPEPSFVVYSAETTRYTWSRIILHFKFGR